MNDKPMDEPLEPGGVTSLLPYFGSNRLLAKHLRELLAGRKWCAVPFCGGMSELLHIPCRSIVATDKHLNVLNLARVVRDNTLRPYLLRRLRDKLFHYDLFAAAQIRAALGPQHDLDIEAAEAYFVATWMGRSGRAGAKGELKGKLAVRWNANGGASAVRYFSALRAIALFGRVFQRCEFPAGDGLEMIDRVSDDGDLAIYCDPPWPGAGKAYLHNAGLGLDEHEWHTRLRDRLAAFTKTAVVCRFQDHPLVTELYQGWERITLCGRDQSGSGTHEVLLTNRGGR